MLVGLALVQGVVVGTFDGVNAGLKLWEGVLAVLPCKPLVEPRVVRLRLGEQPAVESFTSGSFLRASSRSRSLCRPAYSRCCRSREGLDNFSISRSALRWFCRASPS
jgi:hypothetical protein